MMSAISVQEVVANVNLIGTSDSLTFEAFVH